MTALITFLVVFIFLALPWKRFRAIIRELANYRFLRKQLRKHKKTEAWKNMSKDHVTLKARELRVNWIGSIYTVINIPPEVRETEPMYWSVYVTDEMKAINAYLTSINLAEVVHAGYENKMDPSKGQFAYLIKYTPLFNNFTWGWIFIRTILVTSVIWTQNSFNWAEQILNLF